MQNFSDEHFEILSEKILNVLKNRYFKEIAKARDKEYSQGYQVLFNNFNFLFYQSDDTTKSIGKDFERAYKLGYSIVQIIENLKNQITNYNELKRIKSEDRIYKTKYYKLFWFFNSKMIKQILVSNSKNEIISQTDYTYNLTFKNIKLFLKAKTEQERFDIHYNLIEKKVDTIPQQMDITMSVFRLDTINDKNIFKALIRYNVYQKFNTFIKIENPNVQFDEEFNLIKTEQKETAAQVTKNVKKNAQKGKIIPIEPMVEWTKDKTDFYRLIYALYYSKSINNGKGEITVIVEKLAKCFGIKLAKSWQSGKTNAFNYTNAGHSNDLFFDELKKTLNQYIDKLEKK